MKLWKSIKHVWCTLFQRRRWEQEMAEEMRFHREAQVAANEAAGMGTPEARRLAALQFGAVDAITERAREARGLAWLGHLGQDLRYGWRMLLKHKGFTIVAVVTLALGLSANMTIFGLIDVFFFQPLAVKDPGRLVVLNRDDPKNQFSASFSWADYEDYRDTVPGLKDATASLMRPVHLSWVGQQPHRTWIENVSANYFDALGARPHLGRLFLPGEGRQPGADPIVVLAFRYWRDQLGRDPLVIGRTVVINGVPFEVVGVADESFNGAQWGFAPGGWVPATMVPTLFHWNASVFTGRDWNAFRISAHLAPDYDVGRVGSELAVVDARIAPLHKAGSLTGVTTRVIPEQLSRPDPSISGFLPLAAAVFLSLVLMILLIACANVSNLLFARAASRQRELSIRSAVGASRGRLARQLLTESLLLAGLSGVVGWGLSQVAGQALSNLTPRGDMPIANDATQGSPWIMVFAVGISLLAGVVTGLLPAMRATRIDLQSVMKGGTSGGGGKRRHGLRNGLVMAQVAFCAIVLIAGGLFVRSLRQAALIPLGFDPQNLVMASIDLDLQGYDRTRGKAFLTQLSDELKALPGVESVGISTVLAMSTAPEFRMVADADAPLRDGFGTREGEFQAAGNNVDEHFVETMRLPLLRGRGITAQDTADAPLVVVVNEALARKMWPDREAIGQRLTAFDFTAEVVGVVATGRYVMISETDRPAFYRAYAQAYNQPVTLYLRTRGDPTAVLPGMRRVLQRLDPELPSFNAQTMEEHLRMSAFGFMPFRIAAFMAAAQGLVGLLLAVMGVYGVVAYSVSQRSREIGIRIALGADRGDVFRLVVHGGLRLIAVGLIIGLVISLGLSHVLAGLLVGLNPLDLPVFGGVTALLIGVSWLACYVPARRAMGIDPAITLKCD